MDGSQSSFRFMAEKSAVKFDVRPGEPAMGLWIHGWSSVGEVRPICGADGVARFDALIWKLGKCLFNRFETTGQVIRRGVEHLRSASHVLSIQRAMGGSGQGESGGHAFEPSAHALTVIDLAYPYSVVHTDGPIVGMTLPKALIGYESDPDHPIRMIDAQTGRGRIIAQQTDAIFEQLLAEDEAVIDVEPLLRSLRCELAPNQADRADRDHDAAVRLQAIRDHIERHLTESDLSPSTLVNLYGVSRRSLYRRFAEHGGVRAYIAKRRLNRAVADLARTDLARGAVAQVAARWGYSSDAAFSRAVKRAFGCPPGRLLDLETPAGRRPGLCEVYHDSL